MQLIEFTDTLTYQAIAKKIAFFKEEHYRFRTLARKNSNGMGDGYASLAAGTLDSIIVLENLFHVYKKEFSDKNFVRID